jgi:hypothetical protein
MTNEANNALKMSAIMTGNNAGQQPKIVVAITEPAM